MQKEASVTNDEKKSEYVPEGGFNSEDTAAWFKKGIACSDLNLTFNSSSIEQ
jgi:hypothetical protein